MCSAPDGSRKMTTIEQSDVENKVAGLIQSLKENEQFYRTAANNVVSDRLRELLQERAEGRAAFAEELAAYSDVDPEEIANVELMDFLHRGMVTFKAAMTIEKEKTDQLVITDSLQAEKDLLAEYEQLLAEEAALPPALENRLQQQYASIQVAYTYMGATLNETDSPVVVGLFATIEEGQQALDALTAVGIARDQIDVIAESDAVKHALDDNRAQMARESAGAGAVMGGAFGGLVGLAAGVAMALTAGPILILGVPALAGVTLAGTAVGASHGALAGALLGWGVGEDDVHLYIEGVRGGQILLAARVNADQVEKTISLLQQANGTSVAARRESFTETGPLNASERTGQ